MVNNITVSEITSFNFTEGFGTSVTDNFMDEVEVLLIYRIASFTAIYWIPVLAPVGLVGNSLSFLIMMKRNNRNMSTCIYMAAISINDNIMMILFFYDWLLTVVEIHESVSIGCKIQSFLAMFSLQNATFQVVAMTLDKFIAIKWPHRAATYSTPKRAKLVVVIILFCVTIYNIPHVFISKLMGKSCVSYNAGDVYTQVYSSFTFTLNGIVCFICLTAMNLTIIHSVRKSHKRFSNDREPVKFLEDQCSIGQTKQRLRKNTENQLTVMLLLVTTLFLVLLLPTYVRFLYFNYVKRDTPEKYANSMLFYYLSTRLYFTNSGINFFLYCISGRKFREDLKELLSFGRNCTSKRIIKDQSSSTVSSYTGRSETSVS